MNEIHASGSKVPGWGRNNLAALTGETLPARLWRRPSADSKTRGSSCTSRSTTTVRWAYILFIFFKCLANLIVHNIQREWDNNASVICFSIATTSHFYLWIPVGTFPGGTSQWLPWKKVSKGEALLWLSLQKNKGAQTELRSSVIQT